MLWHAKLATYHCRSPACCKTHLHSCSHSGPLSALGGGLCRPSSASLWGPSRPRRTRGKLQTNSNISEQPTVGRTGCIVSFKGFRICKEDVGSCIPKLLGTYVHHLSPKNKTKQNKTISVGQKYNFNKLLLRELEEEIRCFGAMGIPGKGTIIF